MTQVMTVAEAAKRLPVSEWQIRELLKAGKIKGRKIGVQWLIEEAEVERVRHELQESCEECGANVPKDARECPACGTGLDALTA